MLRKRIDIFCRVIDNYGDIGVTWRLAKCLQWEYGYQVQLILDDLKAAKFLAIDPSLSQQLVEGVTLSRWDDTPPKNEVADVVIEAFACELPSHYLVAMIKKNTPLLWINLEYLSAESWIDSYHGLPSLQANGLQKYFFFPGFTERTGGLLREKNLLTERDSFQCSVEQQAQFLNSINVPTPPSHYQRFFIFSYPHTPWATLLDYIKNHPTQVLLANQVGEDLSDGTYGQSTIQHLPFLPQDAFDRVLWSMDINFVRGEDSWIRAHWAKRPFVWQIYAQENNAHHDKLYAWLNCFNAPQEIQDIHCLWNNIPTPLTLNTLLSPENRHTWISNNELWIKKLTNQSDLTFRLANFIQERLK